MRFNTKAQSLVEYLAIFTLLAAGMIAGQQFVTGGVGGGIKNLTDTVDEAFHEPLSQAPVDPNINIPSCNCGPWVKDCGSTTPPGYNPPLSCPGTEMLYYQICYPSGCNNVPAYCQVDNTCCTDKLETGSCGPNSAGYPPPVPAGGCPDGEGVFKKQCGNLPIIFYCGKDPSCLFVCNKLPKDSNHCVGTELRLPQSLDYTLVPTCSTPIPQPDKCKADCKSGYTYNTVTGVCDKCDPVQNVAELCLCRGSDPPPACIGKDIWSWVRAYCPQGMIAESGHCVWRADNWGYGDQMRNNGPITGRPDGWECEGYARGDKSRSTCNQTYLRADIYCNTWPPMSTCARDVLVDLQIPNEKQGIIICPSLDIPRGYSGSKQYQEIGEFSNAHYCKLVDQFVPAKTCNTYRINVMGDSLLIGDGTYPGKANNPYLKTKNANNDWCYSCDTCNTKPNICSPSCFSNTYTTPLDKNYGCCPRAKPGFGLDWKIQGWVNQSKEYLHCLRPEPAIHCPADSSGNCPANTKKVTVVKDAYMRHLPNLICTVPNRCPEPSYGCDWCQYPCDAGYTMYAGIGIPSKMQYCIKKVDICVEP